MSSYPTFTFFFLFIFLVSLRASAQDPEYIIHICPNTTTFTRDSPYFKNLRSLLSSLSSPNASSTGFQSATAGRSPDRVTGLFLCRGDLLPQVCRDCVSVAVYDALVNKCPTGKEATIWYEPCMLRYSHRNILHSLATRPGAIHTYYDDIPENQLDRYNEVMVSVLNQTVKEAADNSRKFAVKSANYSSNGTIYGLAQCTPDLTRQECYLCLQKAINGLDRDGYGSNILLPSCNLKHKLYEFYDKSPLLIPPPPLQPPAPVSVPLQSSGSAKSFSHEGRSKTSHLVTIIIIVTIALSVMHFTAGFFLAKRTRNNYGKAPAEDGKDDIKTKSSLQFDFKTIEAATNNFSESNRIYQNEFGEIYKGTFQDETEVVVRRLWKGSGKSAQAFKNEVVLVAKLQHRNLVRLLGFCLEGEEKILVYEFVPNKSLDFFLFDPTKQGQLEWMIRYKIIGGIARGLLYLHHDSRLTIIHRDLKASNILLDDDMNPKIADFGMARILGMDETQGSTRRVVGTLGYMPPEYVMHGRFSVKSDVYSFGVLVLEIISGKRNSDFSQTDVAEDLTTFAWKLWREGSPLELVDSAMDVSHGVIEVIRCIHIGLLCVQQNPADRPTIATIIPMLTNVMTTLPIPQEPAFFFQESVKIAKEFESDQSTSKSIPWSVDDASITHLEPR